jgi:hypothetical protein
MVTLKHIGYTAIEEVEGRGGALLADNRFVLHAQLYKYWLVWKWQFRVYTRTGDKEAASLKHQM